MSRRIIEEVSCEHGLLGAHVYDEGFSPRECEGGKRTVLSEPSPEMVERAAEALWERASIATTFDSGEALIAARAALTAALFGEEE